ncbi:hypothetical protein TNCV_3629351 [Trichonephila clavipes]|nr:hypothetical protein TNCV_3629351 [Trichonephila clavipes]
MVLKATTNDRRHLVICHDELRGPCSGLCRSGGISNNNKYVVCVNSTGLRSFRALGAEDLRAPWHCRIQGGALGSGYVQLIWPLPRPWASTPSAQWIKLHCA